MIRARVEPKLKKQAEDIFGKLGLNATDAISAYYAQVVLRQGIPFELVVPKALAPKQDGWTWDEVLPKLQKLDMWREFALQLRANRIGP